MFEKKNTKKTASVLYGGNIFFFILEHTPNNWRASVASETLTGVKMKKSGMFVYLFIYIYVWTYVCHFVL